MNTCAGKRFREAMLAEKPLQIVGTINAYIAIMAKQAGFRALYLSGAGVSNSAFGLPDLALTTLNDVLEEVNRITAVVDTPLLVDIDTGWGNSLLIARSIKSMLKAGAAGIHIEDQIINKRCGHRPNKVIVPIADMVDRIKAAVDAKTDPDFVVMARSDAFASEGLERVIERLIAYQEAGADMLFPEALHSLEDFIAIKKAVNIPILANLTEFGCTPLLTLEELEIAGIDLALYPLTVNRTMNKAAFNALKELRTQKTQRRLLDQMQTRQELYEFLNYYTSENQIDKGL